jgi:hypothetical protein
MAAIAAVAMMAGGAGAADIDDGKVYSKAPPKMCAVQVTAKVPCDSIGKSVAEPVETAPVKMVKSDEVCVRRCLSDKAWERCETGSWFANMKGHPNAKPNGDRATKYATARFFEQCGIDCRPRGTMRIGYQSPHTKEWTVFRYGHHED